MNTDNNKLTPEQEKRFDERFVTDRLFNSFSYETVKGFIIGTTPESIKQFLADELARQQKQIQEAVEAALRVLDKAEVEQWFDQEESTKNWKTWKRIRNTITDLINPKK